MHCRGESWYGVVGVNASGVVAWRGRGGAGAVSANGWYTVATANTFASGVNVSGVKYVPGTDQLQSHKWVGKVRFVPYDIGWTFTGWAVKEERRGV